MYPIVLKKISHEPLSLSKLAEKIAALIYTNSVNSNLSWIINSSLELLRI